MTTQTKTAPFRFDIVGSFLRPETLKVARAKFEKNEITADELKKIEDAEIRTLVDKQKEVGLQAVTDGEFRRSWWHLDFMWGLGGVEKIKAQKGYEFNGEVTRAETARLSGKIHFDTDHPFLDHFRFLKEVAGEDVIARQPIPAPAQFLAELQREENRESVSQFYATEEELLADIAKAYQDAIQAFYDLGCRNVQLDDCTWGMFCDEEYWLSLTNRKVDVQKTAEQFVALNNAAIDGHPEDMLITTHVCRGNYHSTWASSGGYDPIADIFFGKENVSAYYLEYDTDRAGDFSPLQFVNGEKNVILGLVSSKIGELEEKEHIIARIQEASQYVPLDRLALSPQCGFASTEEGNILTEEQQWAKLRFIKDIAEDVWK